MYGSKLLNYVVLTQQNLEFLPVRFSYISIVKKVLFILLFCPFLCSGQKQRNFYFEAAGSGGLGSFNYEREIRSTEGIEYYLSIGASGAPIDANNGFLLISPIAIKGLIGKNEHRAELGLGQGISMTTKGSPWIMGLAMFGYRYIHPDKRVFYRVTYTPLISFIVDRQWQHWGGVSIGWKLKDKDKNAKRKKYTPDY